MNRSFSTVFGASKAFRHRSAKAQFLYFKLYMSQANHLCGIFMCGVDTMAFDTHSTVQEAQEALDELVEHRLAEVDPENELVWLPEMINHIGSVANDKSPIRHSILKHLNGLPPCTLVSRVASSLGLRVDSGVQTTPLILIQDPDTATYSSAPDQLAIVEPPARAHATPSPQPKEREHDPKDSLDSLDPRQAPGPKRNSAGDSGHDRPACGTANSLGEAEHRSQEASLPRVPSGGAATAPGGVDAPLGLGRAATAHDATSARVTHEPHTPDKPSDGVCDAGGGDADGNRLRASTRTQGACPAGTDTGTSIDRTTSAQHHRPIEGLPGVREEADRGGVARGPAASSPGRRGREVDQREPVGAGSVPIAPGRTPGLRSEDGTAGGEEIVDHGPTISPSRRTEAETHRAGPSHRTPGRDGKDGAGQKHLPGSWTGKNTTDPAREPIPVQPAASVQSGGVTDESPPPVSTEDARVALLRFREKSADSDGVERFGFLTTKKGQPQPVEVERFRQVMERTGASQEEFDLVAQRIARGEEFPKHNKVACSFLCASPGGYGNRTDHFAECLMRARTPGRKERGPPSKRLGTTSNAKEVTILVGEDIRKCVDP